MKKKDLRDVAAYCAESIALYEERVELALSIMGTYRCSLERADSMLYDEIIACAREWAEDNGMSVNDYDESAINPEEILYASER